LLATGDRLLKVDVRDRADLAKKYGIAIVPTVVAVAPNGEVLERLAP
jgi:thioredoxin-like negative regulator of GroEL